MYLATALLALLTLAGCEVDETHGGATPATCHDTDGDGFGQSCVDGPDCDETDAEVHEGCSWCSSSRPEAGCPCEGQSVVDCYSNDPIVNENGEEVCQAGERHCIDGAWSTCEYAETFPVPDRSAGEAPEGGDGTGGGSAEAAGEQR